MILSASYKVLLINTKKTSSQLQMVQQSNDWVKYILYSVEYLNSSSQVLEQFSEKKDKRLTKWQTKDVLSSK